MDISWSNKMEGEVTRNNCLGREKVIITLKSLPYEADA